MMIIIIIIIIILLDFITHYWLKRSRGKKIVMKMITNAITQLRDKKAITAQDQRKIET